MSGTRTGFSLAVEARLDALNIRTVYRIANAAGLRADFGRVYSPKVAGGTSLRENILRAVHTLMQATGSAASPDDKMTMLIETTPPVGDNEPRRRKGSFIPGEKPPQTGGTGGQSENQAHTQGSDKTMNEAQAIPNVNGIAAAIQAAIAAAMQGASVNADQVRGLVREELERLAPRVIEIKTETGTKRIEERTHARFDDVLKIISTRVNGRRLHVWMTGPSGSGKSHLAHQVATAAGLEYRCTGAIQTPFQLVGFQSPSGDVSTLQTPFRMAFEFGGVFAWDDVDASDPRAFVAFNEALSNGVFAFPDRVVKQHTDFVAIASANTWGSGATSEYVGRNKIDGATLTRFVRISVDYDEDLECAFAGERRAWAKRVQKIRAAVSKLGIKVLVTPRHTLQGAALLATGFTQDDVERMTVFAGMDRDTEAKVRAAA